MKKIFAFIAQFVLFLVIDAAGSLVFHPFHVQTALSGNPLAPRSFVWDGLILMTLVFALILVIQALRKRLATSSPWSALAFVLAALAGYLMQFGFVTRNW